MHATQKASGNGTDASVRLDQREGFSVEGETTLFWIGSEKLGKERQESPNQIVQNLKAPTHRRKVIDKLKMCKMGEIFSRYSTED